MVLDGARAHGVVGDDGVPDGMGHKSYCDNADRYMLAQIVAGAQWKE